MKSARLIIDYHRLPASFEANPTKEYFLGREFLDTNDNTISRAPHAPCLRCRDGNWWLDNDSDGNAAEVRVYTESADQRRYDIPRHLSFRLPDGEVTVWVWHEKYRLSLIISGTYPADNAPRTGNQDSGVTQPGVPRAEENVRALFRDKPRTKIILAALYREYLTPGFAEPKPLNRTEAMQCMGRVDALHEVDTALKDVQRAIWGTLGHGADVPRYLINRRLLVRADQGMVPHRGCPHARPGRI